MVIDFPPLGRLGPASPSRGSGAREPTVGGYRLLRLIGVGSRAEVFLAHPLRPDAEHEPAVIKVYGPTVTDESIVAEVEALSRAAGDHVLRVLDVTSTPEGAPALILSRHAAGSLARVLRDRAHLEAGEAVTVLAPLALALARLHTAGVAHGGIGPGAVLFDAVGSPVLACFGRASLFAPGLSVAGLEAEQSVLADVLAFGSLAATVLEGAGATALAHRARTEAAPDAWLAGFAEELFDLGEPLPVDLRPRSEIALAAFPARAIAAQRAAPLPEPLLESSAASPVVRAREALGRACARVLRAREGLRGIRRRTWIAPAAVLLALLVALVAVPRGQATPAARPSASPTAPTTAFAIPGAVTADDPVAAALVLLEVRERCIRDLSVECFDDVDQRGSGALDADRELVRSILNGAEPAPLPTRDPASVDLVQRLGDSALVSLGADSEPASVLLVKGEAGWRIRGYLKG